MALTDRSCCNGQDAQEISRFSCMLCLSVRGFSDEAGPNNRSRLTRFSCRLPPLRKGVGLLIHRLFEAQSPGPLVPLSTLRPAPHDAARKNRGQDGVAVL